MTINRVLKKKKESIGYSNSFEDNKIIKFWICVFLMITTLAVYWQVQDHKFLNYDDPAYVTDNSNVKKGLTSENVHWAFTTDHFSNWHPVTWLSHMLDYQIYGPHPKGHHLTNLLFHIANTLLLFLVLLRMTGALWQSGFVAALFALHPFNVESVAWIAERKNVLSTFFWLLTLWAYVRYVEKPNARRYGLVALLMTLGLMSKSMLVTLPFVLLMMDYWPLRRLKLEQGNNQSTGKHIGRRSDIWRLVREKIPLLILATGAGIATFIVQKSGGELQAMEVHSLTTRLANAMVSYLEYLKKTLWPEGMSVFYPHPGNDLTILKEMLCGMALLGISAISIRLLKKAPYLAFGWFWYLGTMVPVIQIIQTGRHAMADRYAYIPLIGIFIIVAWGLPELLKKWHLKKMVLLILAGIYIPTLIVITWNQVSHWKTSITLFKHAIRVTDTEHPDFALTHINLGNALLAEQKTLEAISHYKMAIKLKPGSAISHYNLANALLTSRKIEESIGHYKIAIKLKPDFVDAHFNLNIALRQSE